ncbi:hypothetical protein [Georgenia alba]|uniref:Uncharacterized protein n=1 Tax=Georgenia alba TaxID=2233858 RepID=A0ABW2Q4N3_9MICO
MTELHALASARPSNEDTPSTATTGTARPTWFDIHGYATVAVESNTPAEHLFREKLLPFHAAPPSGARPDIAVGLGSSVRLRAHGGPRDALRITDGGVDALAGRVHVRRVGDRFDLSGRGELVTAVLPLVDAVAAGRGAALVRGASFAVGGRGLFIPAWGTAARAAVVASMLASEHVALMGDDWAFLGADGRLLGYAGQMMLEQSDRAYFPHLFAPRSPAGRLADRALRFTNGRTDGVVVHPRTFLPAEKVAASAPLAAVCLVEPWDGPHLELVRRDTDGVVRRILGNVVARLPEPSRLVLTRLAEAGLIGLDEHFGAKGEVLRRALEGVTPTALRVPAAWPARRAAHAIAERAVDLL